MSIAKVSQYALSILLCCIFLDFIAVSEKPEEVSQSKFSGKQNKTDTLP
jgi:hypothetical protein